MSNFQAFPKIEQIGRLFMSITQKIHGTNAQIYIYESAPDALEIKVGCRTRWITPENDNFGFARYVMDHQDDFIKLLGAGRHFGEWAGPGINSGEGLPEKRLYLFNHRRWKDQALPSRCFHVPVLYEGAVSLQMVDHVYNSLRNNGSTIREGYLKPEGIVIEIAGNFYKKVFNPEETGWTSKQKRNKPIRSALNIDYLLQPTRLEKLLSRDEEYMRSFPASLSQICKDYVYDLESENQILGDEDTQAAIRKALGKHIFSFVKEYICTRT